MNAFMIWPVLVVDGGLCFDGVMGVGKEDASTRPNHRLQQRPLGEKWLRFKRRETEDQLSFILRIDEECGRYTVSFETQIPNRVEIVFLRGIAFPFGGGLTLLRATRLRTGEHWIDNRGGSDDQ